MVLAASMLGSPPASTQRCCLTTEVSLSRTQGDPRAKKLGNQPLPPPGAGVWRDTGRDPRVHVERERAGHLAVPGSPPVRRYGPPQPPLQPFPLSQTLLDRGFNGSAFPFGANWMCAKSGM